MKKLSSILLISLLGSTTFLYADETITAEVHGMVCEFCAVGLEKQFEKCDEVESIDVSLEAGTVKLVLKDGQQMDDERITKIITDNGINVASIKRDDAETVAAE